MWDDFVERSTLKIADPIDAAHTRRELREHLQQAYEHYLTEGMSEKEAATAAARDMGDSDLLADRLATVHARPLPWNWYAGLILIGMATIVSLGTLGLTIWTPLGLGLGLQLAGVEIIVYLLLGNILLIPGLYKNLRLVAKGILGHQTIGQRLRATAGWDLPLGGLAGVFPGVVWFFSWQTIRSPYAPFYWLAVVLSATIPLVGVFALLRKSEGSSCLNSLLAWVIFGFLLGFAVAKNSAPTFVHYLSAVPDTLPTILWIGSALSLIYGTWASLLAYIFRLLLQVASKTRLRVS